MTIPRATIRDPCTPVAIGTGILTESTAEILARKFPSPVLDLGVFTDRDLYDLPVARCAPARCGVYWLPLPTPNTQQSRANSAAFPATGRAANLCADPHTKPLAVARLGAASATAVRVRPSRSKRQSSRLYVMLDARTSVDIANQVRASYGTLESADDTRDTNNRQACDRRVGLRATVA